MSRDIPAQTEVSLNNSTSLSPSWFSFPFILWVECKGDVGLSQLLEGFIRVEFAVHYGGGLGILAVPHKATEKLLKHKVFLKQAESIIKLYDVEKGELHQLWQF